MSKRDYGSGSIKEVGPNTYRIRVSAGLDPLTGRRRMVNETFRGGAKDARKRLAELVAARRGQVSGSVTLGQIIDEWLGETNHARATRQNYDRARTRIPERMLAMPAAKIGRADVASLYRATRAEWGAHSVHQLHAVISGAYTHAVQASGWLRENPAWRVALPPLPKRQSTTPTVDEARKIIAAGVDHQQRLWLRLALVLGRRRSEVLALRWSDVDLEAGVVHVARSLELDRVAKGTKTGDDVHIAVDSTTIAAIRSWQLAQRERALAAGMPLASDPWLLSQTPDSSMPCC